MTQIFTWLGMYPGQQSCINVIRLRLLLWKLNSGRLTAAEQLDCIDLARFHL